MNHGARTFAHTVIKLAASEFLLSAIFKPLRTYDLTGQNYFQDLATLTLLTLNELREQSYPVKLTQSFPEW